MSEIKNWLATRRKELKISQEELTLLLADSGFDISRATISNWENDKSTPPLEDPKFRRVLANILQMSVVDLLQIAGYETYPDYSFEARRAADIIEQLDPEQRNIVMGILEQFVARTG